MRKKYVVLLAVLMTIVLFSSIGTALMYSSEERIHERLQENLACRILLKRISQIVTNNGNDVSLITDENDGNDGEDDDDSGDGPKEDVLLPKIWNLTGEKTPDDGNEPVNDSEETTTIDSNGDVEIIQGVWTVDPARERFIKIIRDIVPNGKLGVMLQRTVEHTYAPGTTQSDGVAENRVSTVVVVGGSGGSAENDAAEVVVVTTQGS